MWWDERAWQDHSSRGSLQIFPLLLFCTLLLQDVRLECSKGLVGLVELQKELLCKLCKYEGEFQSVHEGKLRIRQQVTGLRVLVVLADVDKEDQLDTFLVMRRFLERVAE